MIWPSSSCAFDFHLQSIVMISTVTGSTPWSPSLHQDLLIRPFCIMFPTVIYDVFMHNNAFWSNSNAFYLIIYKVHTKKENSDSWKYGPGKATSGYLFCTTPNKLKLHGDFLSNIWWILQQITTRGGPPGGHNPRGRAREPRRALVGCAPLSPPPVPIFWYISHFDLEKTGRGLSGWSTAVKRRNLGRSTFALRQSDSAGGTSLPKGETIVIIITNNSPILGRAISVNIFNITISSQTLVHLLCSTFLPEL